MLSKHANVKLDMLSQHAKCRQAIPTCIAKVTVYKGQAVDNQWTSRDSEIGVGSRDWQINDNSILGSWV